MSIRDDIINSGFVNWLVEHTDDPTTVSFSPTGYCLALAEEVRDGASFNNVTLPLDQRTYLGLKVRIDPAQAELYKVS